MELMASEDKGDGRSPRRDVAKALWGTVDSPRRFRVSQSRSHHLYFNTLIHCSTFRSFYIPSQTQLQLRRKQTTTSLISWRSLFRIRIKEWAPATSSMSHCKSISASWGSRIIPGDCAMNPMFLRSSPKLRVGG